MSIGNETTLEAPPELIPIKEVARMCGISERHTNRLRDRGLMPRPVRLGGSIRWRRTEIEKWIADGCPAVAGK